MPKLLIFAIALFAASAAQAEIQDRVVAFIDEEAITQSELEEAYQKSIRLKPDITRREALETMINRRLLLREARRLRMEAPEDAAVEEYIDLKVRAFIKVSEQAVEGFYKENIKEFKGLNLSAVRDNIETLLREKEVNERLKRHIEELRAKSYIKIIEPSSGGPTGPPHPP